MNTIIKKKTKNMGTLTFKEIDKKTAREMIIKNHYSHKWGTPFGVVNVGVFREDKLLGVAVFGYMMNPNSYSSIAEIEKDEIIELNRLWIDDELGYNAETITLGACWKILRKDHPQIKLVQSFADGRLGVGTIYKASNFKYFGYSTTMFFENIETGEIKHNALFNDGRHPSALIKNNRDFLLGKIRAFKVNTYRYIYVLDKRVKLKLKEKPYPEYQKGMDYIEYSHPDNLLAKLALLYKANGERELALIAYNKIKSKNKKEIIDNQREHKKVKEFIEGIKSSK